jgi:hypothetical protein
MPTSHLAGGEEMACRAAVRVDANEESSFPRKSFGDLPGVAKNVSDAAKTDTAHTPPKKGPDMGGQ